MAISLRRVTSVLLALVASAGAGAAEPPEFHDGESVIRATIRSARDLRTLLVITKDALTHRLDYGPADFIVDAKGLEALKASGVPFEVQVADLGPLLRADFDARMNAGDGGVAGGDFFSAFRTLDEIYAKLDALVAQRPDMVTPFTSAPRSRGVPSGASASARPPRAARASSSTPPSTHASGGRRRPRCTSPASS